jgi:hypothetical protein
MKTAFLLIAILSLGCKNPDANKDIESSQQKPVKTFYARKVNIDITYPSELETINAEEISSDEDIAGAISGISFSLVVNEVQLSEIYFHSKISCSEFYKNLLSDTLNIDDEGDYYEYYYFDPESYTLQENAFQKKLGYEDFKFVKYNGVEFLFKCGGDSGGLIGEAIIFKNDIRILSTFRTMGDKECNELTEQMKALFSKIQFEIHK